MKQMSILKLLLAFLLIITAHHDNQAAAKSQRTIARSQKLKGSKSSVSRDFEKKSTRENQYLNYLPFGFGQFQQQKTWLGIGLAAAQAGSLMFYYDRMQQIKSANNDATVVFNSADLEKDNGLYEFFDSNETFVKKAQQESQIALFSFFSLYAIGVYEALYDPFQLKSPSKKKRVKPILEEDFSWEEHKLPADLPSQRTFLKGSSESEELNLGISPLIAPQFSYGLVLQRNL